MSNTPTIGRIVHYALTEQNADQVNRRRDDYQRSLHEIPDVRKQGTGEQYHVGNQVQAGDVFPMLIVRTWTGDLVNGQVFLDGNDTLWVTSVHEGDDAGTYAWPTVVR